MTKGMIEKERVLDTLQGLLLRHRNDEKFDGIQAAFAAIATLPTVDVEAEGDHIGNLGGKKNE